MYAREIVLGGVIVIATLASPLITLLVRFLGAFVAIQAERKILEHRFRWRFPRDQREIWNDPERFFQLLRKRDVFQDQGGELHFESLEPLKGIETEPDKNATSLALRIHYRHADGEKKQLDVFVKFQTGKGMPVWMQALRAAAEPGVAREVDFYNKLSQLVPLRTPKVYYADKLTSVNLVCIVLEHIDLHQGQVKVIPDHEFQDVEALRLLLTTVAKMHGMFLGQTSTNKATKWIPAKQGLKFCEWVRTLGDKSEQKEFYQVFVALEAYFKEHLITLVHGDCRPGNMMFVNNPVSQVIFADWEATNAAPPVWDFVYCTVLGLPPDIRRAHRDSLFDSYYTALVENTPEAMRNEAKGFRTKQETSQDAMLLTLVLFCISYTITKRGFWKNQGNTGQDLQAWKAKVHAALQDVPADQAAALLKLDATVLEAFKRIF